MSSARILAERMGRDLGQTDHVENRGGANGNIAAEAVAKADPMASVLLYNTSSIAISRALYRTLELRPAARPGAGGADRARRWRWW